MHGSFRAIERSDRSSDIRKFAWAIFENAGVVRHSYHLSPALSDTNSEETEIYAMGFSDHWLDLYIKENFRFSDPIPSRTMRYGALITWRAAERLEPNTAPQEQYFAAMREHGLVHGFGVPLYGPYNRHSYASFDFGKPLSQVPRTALTTVRVVAQAAHQRISVLQEEKGNRPRLSKREEDVLMWIAQGKSVTSIAVILGLSPETVKTYVKRIYDKLDKSDRVGATVEAIKLDLIKV